MTKILNELDQCCAQVDADFQATWTILGSLAPCGITITITAPITITSPGSYCLANDVAGTIFIAADNVVLDLNNKQLSNPSEDIPAALYISGRKNLTIKNGQINGPFGSIWIDSSTYVRIDNVQFGHNTTLPLSIQGSFDVLISNAYFTQNKVGPIYPLIAINDSTDVQLINAIIQANQGTILLADNINGLVLDGCYIINNNLTGTIVPHVLVLGNSTDCTFKNSHFSKNNYSGNIISVNNSTSIVLASLVIEDNTVGDRVIDVAKTSGVLIRDCVVSKNTASDSIAALSLNNIISAVVERNIIFENSSQTTSEGIVITQLNGMIIANEVQGNSTATNYVVTGSGAIPIIELSQSTAAITVISGGPNSTPYHNLSVIP